MQQSTEAQNILSAMTVKELRDIARKVHNAVNGVKISGYSKMVKAELVRQLSFTDVWYFAETCLIPVELDETPAADNTVPQRVEDVKPGTDIQVYTFSGKIVTGVFSGVGPKGIRLNRSLEGLKDINIQAEAVEDFEIFDGETWVGPETSAEEVKSDAVGDSVSAMIDQDAPNRIWFGANESTVNALVTRDAPGMAYVNLGTAGVNVATLKRIRNRYELVSSSGDVVRAGSIAKAVKRWAKRTGITVNRIETVKQF